MGCFPMRSPAGDRGNQEKIWDGTDEHAAESWGLTATTEPVLDSKGLQLGTIDH